MIRENVRKGDSDDEIMLGKETVVRKCGERRQ